MLNTCRCIVAMFALAGAAGASTINAYGLDAEIGLFSSDVTYTLATAGNGSVNQGLTGFSQPTGALKTIHGVNYAGYLALLPVGSTITGATVNYAGIYNLLSASFTPTGSPFFTPTFSVTPNTPIQVTVTTDSGHTAVLSGAFGSYDLWNVFGTDLVAGKTLSLNWTLPFTYAAGLSGISNDYKNRSETFTVKGTADFIASETSNFLSLTYSQQGQVPEPAAFVLAGAGLLLLCTLRRRHA